MSAKNDVENSTVRTHRVLLSVWCVALAIGWASVAVAEPAEDLFGAALRGDAAAVQALLAEGADVNAKKSSGATALMAASANGRYEVVQVLLRTGDMWWNPFRRRADVNAKTDQGATALILASEKGHLDVVQALLETGAAVNAQTDEGVTALMTASATGHLDVVQALLAKGADVNARRYRYGDTALLLASAAGHLEVVKALLGKGAVAQAEGNCGRLTWRARKLVSIERNLFSVQSDDKIETMYTDEKTLFCKEGKLSSPEEFKYLIGEDIKFYQNACLLDANAAGHAYIFRVEDTGSTLMVVSHGADGSLTVTPQPTRSPGAHDADVECR